jgi:hypothetical protein
MANTYSPGYPVNPTANGDTVKVATEKHIAEFLKSYADLTALYQQIRLELQYANVDTVDGKHADGTANNLPILNASGRLTNDLEGKAWNIPTSNVGGNIWIE